MPDRNGVFISHVTEEAPIADALKVYLKRRFGTSFPVFVSSDYESIETGDDWFRAIESAIRKASAVIVLLSRNSLDRRWINFESGLAKGAGVRLVPLAISRLKPGDVGLPLSHLQVRTIDNEIAVASLVSAIQDETGVIPSPCQEEQAFVERLEQIESTLPMKNIRLEPVLQKREPGLLLRFRLSNTGNRDVELIEIEVQIPKAIADPNWSALSIPNILHVELDGASDRYVFWEKPFDGSVDIRYGVQAPLPRVVSPHWTPRLSRALMIPLLPMEQCGDGQVTFKVVAQGLYIEPVTKRVRDIPYES